MLNKLFNFLPYLHRYGLSGLIQRIYHPLVDHYFEKRFQVHTIGSVQKVDLGIEHNESIHYSPVSYKHIFYMLNRIPLKKSASTLLDYGCGKGRVLIAAASYDYEKIIGVELADIIQNAKENVKNMKFRKTKKITFEQMNATDFVIPGGVNVIYFFNPFFGYTLEKVVENIHKSMREVSRKMYIIYFNNNHFDDVIQSKAWITKIHQSEFYRDLTGAIYQVDPLSKA